MGVSVRGLRLGRTITGLISLEAQEVRGVRRGTKGSAAEHRLKSKRIQRDQGNGRSANDPTWTSLTHNPAYGYACTRVNAMMVPVL